MFPFRPNPTPPTHPTYPPYPPFPSSSEALRESLARGKAPAKESPAVLELICDAAALVQRRVLVARTGAGAAPAGAGAATPLSASERKSQTCVLALVGELAHAAIDRLPPPLRSSAAGRTAALTLSRRLFSILVAAEPAEALPALKALFERYHLPPPPPPPPNPCRPNPTPTSNPTSTPPLH